MTDDIRNCHRCQRPVVVHSEDYSLFESMHWLCFHLEFEHDDIDPDEACTDPKLTRGHAVPVTVRITCTLKNKCLISTVSDMDN